MSDELRDAVESAYETEAEAGNADTSPVTSDVPDTPAVEPQTAPAEAPAAPGPAATPAPAPEKAPVKAPEKSQEPPVEHEAPESRLPRIDRAPASWKGEAKAVWASLPLHIRQEVVRRERDITHAMQEHAETRKTLDSINQTVAPYADLIQRNYGGSPAKAVQQLFEVERILNTAPTAQKAQFVANLIKHYQIDIQALDGFLAGQPSPENQQQLQIQQLLDQRLAPLTSFVQQQQQLQQQQQQQRDQAAQTTVEQMATDPQYPYFDEVRHDMADIIDMAQKRGVYLSLPEAYSRAVRMNDLDVPQQAQIHAQEAQQRAQRARAASSSVSGSPVPQQAATPDPSDLMALLSANYDQMGGRI